MSQNPPRTLSRFSLVLLLGALSTISPFSIDMYLPAFAGLAEDLHTTVARVGLSVSSYFIGLAIGQVVYGPLLDRYGRKRPLYVGLGLYLLATVGCIQSSQIEPLIVFRLFQALGGCVAMVAATAMVRDFFHPSESTKIFSFLILILGVSPLLAPTVGSVVVLQFGWQWVFGFLGLFALAVLLATIFFLPEGHQPDPSISLHPLQILNGFKEILQVPQFTVYALTGALSFAGLFSYVAGSPALFMGVYHISAKGYGLVFAGLSVAFIGGSQVNLWLGRWHSSAAIFRACVILQASIGIVFLFGACLGALTLTSTLIFLFGFLACLGIASPNATALALAPFSKNVGSASALLGFLQMGIGALASSLTGVLDLPGALPTVAAMSSSAFIGCLYFFWGQSKVGPIIMVDDVTTPSMH